jgi:hypothetical protein
MTLTLHEMYSFDDAIEAFGEATPEYFCRDNFVVMPGAVICLATLGDPKTEPFLPSPSRLNWKRPDCKIWLPEKVTEVFDRSGTKAKKIRDHHVFLRSHPGESFCYAGPAHLGSYGGPNYVADFFLKQKLPREAWLRYGGYPGWNVEVNHEDHAVDAGDVQTFRRLSASLLSQDFSHLCMTRYEEDSLSVYVNEHRGWLMYLCEPGDGGISTFDVDFMGDRTREEVFRCGCGIDLEYPAASTLPREKAVNIAVEFFSTGELPKDFPWVTNPWDVAASKLSAPRLPGGSR